MGKLLSCPNMKELQYVSKKSNVVYRNYGMITVTVRSKLQYGVV